jgi:uncharacterized protein
MKHILPLYSFFSSLQKHADFSLGIEEYKALIEVLQQDQAGRYFQNPEEMLKVCRLLWFKPNQNYNLFKKLFEQSFGYLKEELAEEERKQEDKVENDNNTTDSNQAQTEPKNQNQSQNQNQTQENKPNDTPDDSPIPTSSSDTNEPLFLNFEEGSGKEEANVKEGEKRTFDFIRNYVPIRERELTQHWRFLKRHTATNQIDSTQINIKKTIQELTENGFILKPFFKTKKQNKANLLTLIDYKGSMIAFKHLAHTLAESAKKAGIQNKIFFFSNVPQAYQAGEEKGQLFVYENQAQTKHLSLKKLFENQANGAVLIISDAGTGGGNFNLNRIEATEVFLREVYAHTLKVAWLNPMPQDRWDGSSAYLIREMVDMFEANAQGLQKAIRILQGKVKPNSAILFPNF